MGGQTITLIGRHFGTSAKLATRSLLLGENTWLNASSITYVSDTELRLTSPPGAGVHPMRLVVDGQSSVVAVPLQYRAPFLESATVGLFGEWGPTTTNAHGSS